MFKENISALTQDLKSAHEERRNTTRLHRQRIAGDNIIHYNYNNILNKFMLLLLFLKQTFSIMFILQKLQALSISDRLFRKIEVGLIKQNVLIFSLSKVPRQHMTKIRIYSTSHFYVISLTWIIFEI